LKKSNKKIYAISMEERKKNFKCLRIINQLTIFNVYRSVENQLETSFSYQMAAREREKNRKHHKAQEIKIDDFNAHLAWAACEAM
jgi:hypothetical protein